MDDKKRAELLEAALARMLEPLRDIPFSAIVRAVAQCRIIPVDASDATDAALIKKLTATAEHCGREIKQTPIIRPRPNEVGNDVEAYVLRGAAASGLKCERPSTAGGRSKSVGYPDIIIREAGDRVSYLECKIYAAGSEDTTFRSFYLSPSEDAKICHDARHLLLAFEMTRTPIANSSNSQFTAAGYKIVDLHDLLCDVKYEFNSDNRRLYRQGAVLAQGRIP